MQPTSQNVELSPRLDVSSNSANISTHVNRSDSSSTDIPSLNELVKTDSPSFNAEKFRVQFAHEGMCVGVSTENDLQVSFCDPNLNQTFYFLNGSLVEDVSSLCVGLKDINSKELALVECSNSLILEMVSGTISTIGGTKNGSCIVPLSNNRPTSEPKLGAAVALANCGGGASRINILDERAFLEDRRALLKPSPSPISEGDKCNRAANVRPAMAQLLPDSQVSRCQNLTKCVTIVVKTARRPQLVIRLAESIRSVLHHDLPMIVIDDGPNPHPPKIQEQLSKYPKINYLVANVTDLGISEGRMLGVNMVKTKYFVNMDDDNVVTKSWNAAKMAELLDKTDLSLVGARTDSLNWPGFLEFKCENSEGPVLIQYMGSCRIANQGLPIFPKCVRCDLTSNSFMAKTKDVLEVGGWSRELKVGEHHDLFLRLKGGGKKVAWCPTFLVLNLHPRSNETSNNVEYNRLRHLRMRLMRRLFYNHWNILGFRKLNHKAWSELSFSETEH